MNASTIFDRARLRKSLFRARTSVSNAHFLFQEAAERLCDRLDDITHRFPIAADIGTQTHALARSLAGRGGIKHLIECHLTLPIAPTPNMILCDEELLPFAKNSLDAVFSVMALHHVNDLPGTFAQIFRALKPDGLLLMNIAGASSLRELRESLAAAEIALMGGMSPRVSPFVEVRDAGGLLQRAGFALPVVDSETLTITYDSMFALMRDLRDSGHTNVLSERIRTPTRRSVFMHAADHYAAQHNDSAGRINATCEILTLTAWKPAANQQQPLKRGSATSSLKTALS